MLITVFLAVIAPIFLLIAVGIALDRRFRLDLPTLSKLNFYAFVPALTFVKLLEAEIRPAQMFTVGLFTLAHAALLLALAWSAFSFLKEKQTILTLGTIFTNAGNYGIPFVLLAFGDAQIGVITTVLVVQNLLTFTLGIWLMERKAHGAGQVLGSMLRVPVVYAVALALTLRAFHLVPPAPIYAPLKYLSDGLIPIALLTLGAQLARTRLTQDALPLSAVTAMRLLVSPLLAALLVVPFGFTAPVSAVLIASAGFPVAVNVYILAAEYRRDEELASQSIFLTTLLSGLTLSLLLVLLC